MLDPKKAYNSIKILNEKVYRLDKEVEFDNDFHKWTKSRLLSYLVKLKGIVEEVLDYSGVPRIDNTLLRRSKIEDQKLEKEKSEIDAKLEEALEEIENEKKQKKEIEKHIITQENIDEVL